MAGAGEGGTALPEISDAGPVRAPLLDRLIASAELHPLLGEPTLVPTMMYAGLAMPLMVVAVVLQSRTLGILGLLMFAVAVLVGLGEGVRAMWKAGHPYASPRWLRAVRAVAGDEVMSEAIADLNWWHRRDPDYVIKRSDLIDRVRAVRGTRRDAAKRACGVRLAPARDRAPVEHHVDLDGSAA